jgi:hypothetical protein
MDFSCTPEIRQQLSKLISPQNGDNWWKPELFEKNTRHLLPKEIEILEPPPPIERQYSCFAYVLGLNESSAYLGKSRGFLYQLSFFPKLIANKILVQKERAEKGDLILYQTDKGVVTHSGILESPEVVISKWSWGPLIRHRIFCVPEHYGDKVSFYEKPDQDLLSKIIDFGRKGGL